jgi:DNA repair exonuclease SbcCD ATPase subunit
MRILGLVAENFKRLRLVEIVPKGRVVKISGANGQGKTSVIDAFRTALAGKKRTQEMPVRKGAGNAKIRMLLGGEKVEWVVKRTIAPNGTQQLTVESGKGVVQGRPQELLDALQGEICMDPTEFVRMKPKEQAEILRRIVKLYVDVEAINNANDEDFKERTAIGRDVKQIEGELAGMNKQEGLPAEKVDDGALLEAINGATQKNQAAMLVAAAKNKAKSVWETEVREVENSRTRLSEQETRIHDLKESLRKATDQLENLKEDGAEQMAAMNAAKAEYELAPVGEYVDTMELTAQLQSAQLVNREIDKRVRYDAVRVKLDGKRREYDTLTRAMEDRTEKKRQALNTAKMPVEGLTFDENQVLFRGVPLEQMGEAEQILICTRIAMSENPKLRVLPILHGESMDDAMLVKLEEIAEEMDFQILMSLVDTSGKVGFVIEDGMVKTENVDD